MAFYHTVTEEQSQRQGGSCFWALLLHVDILGPEISSANSMRGSGKMTNFPAAQNSADDRTNGSVCNDFGAEKDNENIFSQ